MIETESKYPHVPKYREESAMTYFTMILIGLHVLHSKNVWHRDLKPANIFIYEYPNKKTIIKIGDFGVSKFGNEESKY